MTSFTPREIVSELDRYIVGQNDAKRAVAIALRNRWRRLQLDEKLREEVLPKNILMIGPTGVGKTEIARRLARLTHSPFVKVEASKFTEVGYVGRDVESMIRDLVEIAIDMVREEKLEDVSDKAEINAEERLLDLLLPSSSVGFAGNPRGGDGGADGRRARGEGRLQAAHPGGGQAARLTWLQDYRHLRYPTLPGGTGRRRHPGVQGARRPTPRRRCHQKRGCSAAF